MALLARLLELPEEFVCLHVTPFCQRLPHVLGQGFSFFQPLGKGVLVHGELRESDEPFGFAEVFFDQQGFPSRNDVRVVLGGLPAIFLTGSNHVEVAVKLSHGGGERGNLGNLGQLRQRCIGRGRYKLPHVPPQATVVRARTGGL